MRSSSIFKARGLLLHESALGQPLSKIASGQKSEQKCESFVAAIAVVFTFAAGRRRTGCHCA